MLITFLYVDDFIFLETNSVVFDKFKKFMMNEFDVVDLRLMHYLIGIEVVHSIPRFHFFKRNFIWVLDEDCNFMNTLIGFGLKVLEILKEERWIALFTSKLWKVLSI